MKIAVASLHPRVLSGQIDSLAGLGRALTRQGHDLSLVAPFDTTGLLDRSLISLDDGPRSLTTAALRMLRTVSRIIEASADRDLLHLSLPTPAFTWLGDYVRTKTSIPVAVAFEGHLASARQLLDPQRLRRSWKTYLPLWGINNGLFGRLSRFSCPAYVVSSNYQRDELLRLGFPETTIQVIPNVVEGSKLAARGQAESRARLNLPADKSIAGYIGHFNDVKGVDLLASAFASIAQKNPDAHLALAWSGQGDPNHLRSRLAGLEDRVSWLGKVHVGSFLSAVDVLALPYRSTAGQGAFPSLVLEAVEAGCPLVTTDLPLIREVVMEHQAALLFQPEQTEDLTAKLEQALSSSQLRSVISAAQRALHGDRFSTGVLAGRYEQLYLDLTQTPRKTRVAQAA